MGTKVGLFIHIVLAVQLALPLSYYACRTDKYDERFAWRMFSPVRMVQCQTAMFIGEERQPVPLAQTFHEAWRTLATRGRGEVVVAMAHALCERNPGKPVYVEQTCSGVDGKTTKRGGAWNICALESL